jgi:retron-type reverse transcriptase
MIEQVINRRNMHLAYQQVVRNKGSAGVDGMQVSELKPHIRQEGEAIVLRIINGSYLPQPILGVTIPKSNGKTRLLGIPTVTDRWLQQVVAQTIHHYSRLSLKNIATVSDPTKMHTNAYSRHSSASTKVISISLT